MRLNNAVYMPKGSLLLQTDSLDVVFRGCSTQWYAVGRLKSVQIPKYRVILFERKRWGRQRDTEKRDPNGKCKVGGSDRIGGERNHSDPECTVGWPGTKRRCGKPGSHRRPNR